MKDVFPKRCIKLEGSKFTGRTSDVTGGKDSFGFINEGLGQPAIDHVHGTTVGRTSIEQGSRLRVQLVRGATGQPLWRGQGIRGNVPCAKAIGQGSDSSPSWPRMTGRLEAVV